MAHGDAREGKWRGNWRMEWVASTLHTTSEHGVSSITTANAHTSAASSQLNWRRFKWTRPFRQKTKYGFCACAITFQTQSTFDMSNHRSGQNAPAHQRPVSCTLCYRSHNIDTQLKGSMIIQHPRFRMCSTRREKTSCTKQCLPRAIKNKSNVVFGYNIFVVWSRIINGRGL